MNFETIPDYQEAELVSQAGAQMVEASAHIVDAVKTFLTVEIEQNSKEYFEILELRVLINELKIDTSISWQNAENIGLYAYYQWCISEVVARARTPHLNLNNSSSNSSST